MTKRQFGILASLQVAILASVIGVGAVLIQRLDSPRSGADLAAIRGAVSSSFMLGTRPRSLYDVASDAAAAAAAAQTAAGEAASSAGDAAKAAKDILDMTYTICDKLNC